MFTLQTSFKPLLLIVGGGGGSKNHQYTGGKLKTSYFPIIFQNSASELSISISDTSILYNMHNTNKRVGASTMYINNEDFQIINITTYIACSLLCLSARVMQTCSIDHIGFCPYIGEILLVFNAGYYIVCPQALLPLSKLFCRTMVAKLVMLFKPQSPQISKSQKPALTLAF